MSAWALSQRGWRVWPNATFSCMHAKGTGAGPIRRARGAVTVFCIGFCVAVVGKCGSGVVCSVCACCSSGAFAVQVRACRGALPAEISRLLPMVSCVRAKTVTGHVYRWLVCFGACFACFACSANFASFASFASLGASSYARPSWHRTQTPSHTRPSLLHSCRTPVLRVPFAAFGSAPAHGCMPGDTDGDVLGTSATETVTYPRTSSDLRGGANDAFGATYCSTHVHRHPVFSIPRCDRAPSKAAHAAHARVIEHDGSDNCRRLTRLRDTTSIHSGFTTAWARERTRSARPQTQARACSGGGGCGGKQLRLASTLRSGPWFILRRTTGSPGLSGAGGP